MSLNFDSSHFQTSFPTWAGVFRVAVAAAVAPVDYVLAGMVAAGLGAEAISLYLGLARTALFERLVELGLPAPHDRPLRRAGGRHSWSTEDVQQLIAWWVAGIHVRSIAVGLGRSRSAIYAKRRRIGLPDRERKRLVYRSLSELAATSWDGGVPPDNAAPVHHGVGASVNSLLPLATGLGSCVGEPVVVTGGALVLPVQESMLDVFEAAQSSKALSPAGVDHVEVEPQPSVEEASPPEYTASFLSEPQTGIESGRSRGVGRERPAGLSAAIDELRRFCKKTQGPGDEPDWKRLKVSEEFILELALRALAAQSREGIARDMGITASMAANRVSRLDIMRRRRKLVDEFNIEAALENLATSGLVARTCKGLKRLFFVRKGDSRRFCRDWDKIQKRREKGDGRKEMEKTARTTDKPQITLPILKWMKRPFPIFEGDGDKLCGGQASPV